MRRHLDRFVRLLAALLVGVFYRRVEVVGLERVPRRGPVLLVANHPNSLVDPILLAGTLPRMPRFLAKSTLWQSRLLRPLLTLAGAVPVYRRQDEGEDTAKNRGTFARCHEELVRGGAVALFPEGISHHEPALQSVRTGAARIVLEAEIDDEVTIVPVGLDFEEKGRFRSRALLVVGETLDPAAERALHTRDPRGAVRALTERIAAALRAVTPNHGSWREARLVERVVDVYAAGERSLPGAASLAGRLPLRQRFAAAWVRLADQHPARAAAVERLVARYDALLERHRLRDDQLTARYPASEVALYLFDRVPLLALWLPAALVGAALNLLPAAAARLAGRLTAKDPQNPATYKLLTAFFLSPLVWTGQAVAAGVWLGAGAGFVSFAAAPLAGFAAIRFREEHERLLAEVSAWLRLRLRRDATAELRACRREVGRELRSLAAVGMFPGRGR